MRNVQNRAQIPWQPARSAGRLAREHDFCVFRIAVKSNFPCDHVLRNPLDVVDCISI